MRQLGRRLLLVTLLALLLALSLVTPAAQAKAFPKRIPLPNGFQPEGIAIRGGPFAYFGSRVDGDIYRANLRTGKGRVISQGPGTPSLGMKLDGRGRLFVAGGSGGDGRVIDTDTGRVLRSWTFTTSTPTFVNDVVLAGPAAYFTDSNRPVLYRVPLGNRLARQSEVRTIRLTGAWQQTPGFNANGIARTPDHRALLVVQSSTGSLFRVRPGGRATRVDLGSTVLTNGDGLLLVRRTLYVVQNQLNRIAVLRLNEAGREGHLTRRITSTAFDVPTTVARFRGWLYAPNARFTTPPTPTTTYSATRVPR
jgi:sugar lactone lactonase YvrE